MQCITVYRWCTDITQKCHEAPRWLPSMAGRYRCTLLSFALALRISVGWRIPCSSVGGVWGSRSTNSWVVNNRVKLLGNTLSGAENPRYCDRIMVRGGATAGGEVGSTSGGDDGSIRSRSSEKFKAAISANFPGSLLPEAEFAEKCSNILIERGFDADSSISCISVCRDEICSSLIHALKKKLGSSFCLRSLGGFLSSGRTAFGAAHSHTPMKESNHRVKYTYIVAPHIGVSSKGIIGNVERIGQPKPSDACGALRAFQGALSSGQLDGEVKLDPCDMEMSTINQLLSQRCKRDASLADVTKEALKVIQEQLESIIKELVNEDQTDYAVISGIQVHGPGVGNNFFWPSTSYTCESGKRRPIDF